MDYVRVNKLWVKPQNSTNIVQPYAVQLGYNKKYRLTKGDTVVWDVLRTTFNAYNFTIGAEGGYVPSYSNVDSYGVNYLNQIEYLNWDCDTYWIDENTSTSPVTHYITYTQEGTGEKVTVVCTQEGKQQDVTVTGYRYEAVVTKEEIGKAPATNSYTTLSLKVSGTVYIYEQYSDDTESYYGSHDFSSITAYVYDGSSTTGAYCATGNVIVPPVGTTTYTGDRVAFTITKYSFDFLNETFHETTSKDVYQAENKITGKEWGTSASDYSLSISSSVSSFTSNGGTSTISVQCQQRYRDVYTSGSKGEWIWADATASISTSYGSLNKSSITGKGTATLTVGKDYGTGTTAVVTASVGNGTKTATVSVPQTKRVSTGTSYGEPSVVSAYQDTNIPAWGGYAYLMVDWSQTKYINYDNDTHDSIPVAGTSRAVILGGTVQQTGASLQSDGGIYKSSCGTTVTPQRTVYTVTAYYFTANGVGKDVRPVTIHLGQAPNKVESTQWLSTYNISVGYSPSGSISNTGGTKTISVSCEENGKETYTSTATKNVTRNATATVTTSHGWFTDNNTASTTVTGTGSKTLHVNENISDRKLITVTAKAGSTSKSIDFYQDAVVWEFTAINKTLTVGYNVTSVTLTGVSSRNGFYEDISKGDVYTTGATVGTPTNSGTNTTFNIPISFSANNSTTSKTITVVVTQPISGKKLTYTITQNGKPQDVDMINWQTNSGVYIPGARYTFFGKLIYRNTITSNIAVQVLKNTSVISNQNIPPSGSYYNTNYNIMDVTIEVLTDMSASDIFYLRATYGSDVAQIKLIESLDPL